jgi:hypothetical protein
VSELCRDVEMVDGVTESSLIAGWINLDTLNTYMAAWLSRAINMENVSLRCDGMVRSLPVRSMVSRGKRDQNVVTSVAKTSCYRLQHTSTAQHRTIARVFEIKEEDRH